MITYDILKNLARILVLLLALILHEIAHVYIAYKNGDNTARSAGRLTLNPLAHFEPMGLAMLLFLPVGFAKPVPINPNNFRRRKMGIFTVAIAGVSLNLLLALLFTIPYTAFMMLASPAFLESALGYFIGTFLYYMCAVNLSLCVFNLLPIYPLDGFRVIESFTRYNNKFCMFMRRYGMFILTALLIWSVVVQSFLVQYVPWITWLDPLGTLLGWLMNAIWTPFLRLWTWIFGMV